jgi:glycerol-3-phosphate O-acyltransferase
LLSYLVDGFDPEGERDIVFVPVAINYDRVLEDRVLMAAHARGDRRFGARISVVVAFILRKLWQRLRRHDTRFGTAAVAFGDPISLRAYGKVDNVNGLSNELMSRIEAVMPVLGVPLVATALQTKGPLSVMALEAAVAQLLAQMPRGSISIDENVLTSEVETACLHMQQHRLVSLEDGVWRVMDGQETAVAFYANSIAHYLPEVNEPENAAGAKEISAPAGS